MAARWWASTRDAEYLAVTGLQGDALVTVDAALTPKAKGLLPLAPLGTMTTPSSAPRALAGVAAGRSTQ